MIRFGKFVIEGMFVLLCVGGRGRLVWRFGASGRKMSKGLLSLLFLLEFC